MSDCARDAEKPAAEKEAAVVSAEAPAQAGKAAGIDSKALYNIGYGLYVITTNDGTKDTGCVVNSVIQAANAPLRVVVCIIKANYTYEAVHASGILNVNCLDRETPFSVFQHFGFRSGRTVDKFAEIGDTAPRSANGLICLPEHVNSFLSLKVEKELDLGSHAMFICEVTESKRLSTAETMTYAYYQSDVKPKPQPKEKKGWVCRVCGYVYEGDELPEDFICPTCKHGTDAFEKLQ